MITWLSVVIFALLNQPETADAIMARVAANQRRAQEVRTAFVYHQNVMIRFNRSNGKLAREEYHEFTVTPTPKGFKKDETLFRGKYADHGKEVEFDKPGYEHKNLDLDANLANDLLSSFTNDSRSRDGIEGDLFPLRAREQRKYRFRLEGEEEYRGIPVYRITFIPKKTSLLDSDDGDGDIWAGEILVHRSEYQPVLITTHMAAKMPALIKTLLGTNVQQLGFKLAYKKFDEGLWFPVSYGGEFKLRGLFFYARTVGVSLQNSGFQRANVESRLRFAEKPQLLTSVAPWFFSW